MKPVRAMAFALALLASTSPAFAQRNGEAVPPSQGLYVYPDYDTKRDANVDLATAITAATVLHRRILIEVGGDWCVWCHILDRFIAASPEITEAFRQSFVVVKVNYSLDRPNAKFLGKYPKIPGYPHFFVLESDGTFLKSQDTSPLEKGDSYNRDKVLGFARSWVRN
ncbi:MAG: thioredoxin family protein [Alphaproteobacteria bacterium]